MTIVEMLLPEFDREMSVVRTVLARVPDDKLDWKPHVKSFSLGELATHVANLPQWGAMSIAQSELDLAGTPRTTALPSRAAMLDTFDANVTAARAALAGKTDAELLAPWTLKRNGKTVFSMPKTAVFRAWTLNHLIHHRAQLCVYLRLLDQPVPSVYGPSADEPAF
jgi:uncharacterized damage-inducible protein DinB